MKSSVFFKKLSTRARTADLSQDQEANFRSVLVSLDLMLNKIVDINRGQLEMAFRMIIGVIGNRESGGDWNLELLPIVLWLHSCNLDKRSR